VLLRDAAGVLLFSRHDANLLWSHWQSEYRQVHSAGLPALLERYQRVVEEMQRIDDAKQIRVLRAAKIVAITTSGAASHQRLLSALQPKVVVCEEAGEVLESHIVAALTQGTEQLIMIGKTHAPTSHTCMHACMHADTARWRVI
jgi:precorrin-6x reductase